jgi:hypothetical protein
MRGADDNLILEPLVRRLVEEDITKEFLKKYTKIS